MRKLKRVIPALLSLVMLLSGGAVTAGAMFVGRYAGERLDPELLEIRCPGTPAVLYAYDPENRAGASGNVHPAPNGVICPPSRSVFTPFDDFPAELIAAFVSVEDKRFFLHKGIDLYRTVRAGVNYLTGSGRSFGASTITQQLVKNLTGNDAYTLDRKLGEIFQALELERCTDKESILEAYLNIINLGNGCFGVGAAAEYYFSKSTSDLSLSECACLAAITNNPALYDPITHPDENRSRREMILHEMCRQGYITETERDDAVREGITLELPEPTPKTVTGWYADLVISDVIRDLRQKYGYSARQAATLVYAGGLTVYTAMDEELQSIVEAYYADESNFPSGINGRPQSAMMILDPRTGDVLAVAGAVGQKTADRIQNYATDTKRPAGSAIKPLSVFAPALERGLITWSSIYDDEPLKNIAATGNGSGQPWPRNADGLYRGRVTVCEALTQSLNTVAVRILDEVGVKNSFDFLHDRLHMTGLVPPSNRSANDLTVSSLALGQQSGGVTARELIAAYTVFYDGVWHAPVTYRKVVDADGRVLLENKPGGEIVLSRETAGLMQKLLSEVTAEGTARSMTRTPGMGIETAGKTGTTQNNCDRWFIGMTPRLLAGVWLGYDYPAPLTGISGNPALTVWDDVISACEKVYHGAPEKTVFDTPSDLVRVTYCKTTGDIPTQSCADSWENRRHTGWYVRGTEPHRFCTGHAPATDETVTDDTTGEYREEPEELLPETEPGQPFSSQETETDAQPKESDTQFPSPFRNIPETDGIESDSTRKEGKHAWKKRISSKRRSGG